MTATAFGQLSVTNPDGVITINDNAQASPYPSTNFVQNANGVIEKVTVTLNGVSHDFPDDIDMILQSPDGTRTMLMSDAGGNNKLINATFTLDSSAASPLPDEGQIVSGNTYQPANYGGGDLDTFAADTGFPGGSQGGLAADLSFFNNKTGSAVNGTWKLYVMDDTLVSAGKIQTWTLNLYMSPTVLITNTSPVAMLENTPRSINVFVNDSDTPLTGLTPSATAADTSIISGLTFSGSGTNRVLTITPALNASGTTTITVVTKDDQGSVVPGVNSQTFTVTVAPVNQPPVLRLGTSTTTIQQGGLSTNIFAQITDVDTDPQLVTLTATSSNPSVVNPTNVLFRRFDVGGTVGTNRIIQIAPTGSAVGTATVTIIATDVGANNTPAQSTSQTITVTVVPAPQTIAANATPIVIPDGATATPYPSTVTVSGVAGLVGKVTVSLINIEHPNPADLGVLLVTPSGAKIVLMRGVGDSQLVGIGDGNDVRITFDQDVANLITTAPLVTGSYRPNDFLSTDFPAPAPAGGYNADLTFANGTNPNGDWKLYAYDTTANGGGGQIAGGWVLQIFPAPTIAAIGNKTTSEDKPISISFNVSDQLGSVTNVTAVSSDTSIVPNPTVTLGGSNGDATRTATLVATSAADANGIVTITVTAKDNSGFTASQSFNLTVTPVNDAPTVTAIHDQIVHAGQTIGPIQFTVGDVETPAGNLIVTATSDNPKLLPPGSVVVGGSGANRTITLFPSFAQGGSANITVTVTDSGDGVNPPASVSTSFTLLVQQAGNPLFDNSNGIAVNDNAPATPYPSVVNVTGLQGNVAEVQVTLFGITHPAPDGLDIMLVGPGNNPVAVEIMSDAGDAAPLSNVTLRFRDSASGALPDESQIFSGDYTPSDYAPSPDFPVGGSPAPTAANLAAFNGINPNGDWKLYVNDDSPGPRGGVITSWQLSIRTSPAIPAIADQTTSEDKPLTVSIPVGDNQLGVPLTLTVSSTPVGASGPVIQNVATSTGQLIGPAGVQVFGSPQNLTFNLIPDANGTNAVTVTVTDGTTTSTRTFNLIVTPVDDPPRFGVASNHSTPTATPVSFNFDVVDPEGTAVTVVATSSDESVVSNADLANAISPKTSTSATRAFSVTPPGIGSGSTTITLTASDSTGQKSTVTFVLTVTPNVSFINTNPIIINDFATATPYPSTIPVSGVNGTVSGATVIISGLTHPFPDDVDILLVSPDGRAVMLMSDAGGGNPVNGVRLTFSDASNTPIPDEAQITTGTYHPANYDGGDTDEMPGIVPPAGGFSTALANFAGANPNGNWGLFVRDDTFTASGQISGGWILQLQTAPTVSSPGSVKTLEDTPVTIPITVSDQDTPLASLQVTATINGSGTGFDNPNLLASVSVVTNSSGVPVGILVQPSTNRPATLGTTETNSVTVTVSDGTTQAASTTLVIVQAVNDAPQLSGAFFPTGAATPTNTVTTGETTTSPAASSPVTVRFRILDVDSSLGTSTNVTVISENPTLLPNKSPDNINVSGPNNQAAGTPFDVIVTLTPAANLVGSAVVDFIVHDELTTVTNQLTLVVTNINNLPTITVGGLGNNNSVSVIAGSSINNLPVTLGDVETAAEDLTLTATSENTGVIPNANINIGGRGANRSLTITSIDGVTGTATIDLVVSDTSAGKTTNKFNVVVNAAPGSTFANTASITIPAGAPATTTGPAGPYPSQITVGGMIGNISKITVTVQGLIHTAPDDIDMLLVGPNGQKVMLMSDAGGRNPINNVTLVFDDVNGALLPDDGQLTSGTYKTADYEPGADAFPSSAPAGPYSSGLQQVLGTDPNGPWKLFIVDDTSGDVGQLVNGWSMHITTGPTISLTSPIAQPFFEDTTGTFTFTINDLVTPPQSLAVTFNSSNPAIVKSINTNWVSVSGNQATITATVVPVTNAFGTNTITVTVTRSDTATSSFTVNADIAPVNDVPTLSRLLALTTSADTPVSFPILITDADTPLSSNIWVQATPSNPSVITDVNILIAGKTNFLKGLRANGSSASAFPPNNQDSWTNVVTLVPNANASGSSTITITLFELDNNGSIQNTIIGNFLLTVTPVNHAPVITGLTNFVSVEAGKTTPNLSFTVTDPDNDSPLTITGSSSDPTLVRNSDIIVDVPSGPSGARTVHVVTQPGVQGDATVSLVVTDPSGAKSSASVVVRLTPTRERVFANNHPITIQDNTSANPYPSTIDVSGFAGAVSKVTVTLNGFWHTFPDDVDMILVSPSGKVSYLMSDAGGGGGGNAIQSNAALTLHFDDTDPSAVPVPDNGPLTSRTYSVANYEGTDTFPSPAPTGTYPAALNTFNGSSPNGTWSLFIVDDTASDSGAITNGWSIGITTLPVLAGLQDVTGSEDVPIVLPFTVADESFANPTSYSFAVSSSNPALVPSSTNNIVVSGTGTNLTVTVIPAANANNTTAGGNALITLTEQTTGISGTFHVSFAPVNDLPLITPATIADQTIAPGGFAVIPNVNYSDVETAKKFLTVSLSTSDPTVIPTNNIALVGNNLQIFAGTKPGTSTITLAVADTDGGSSSVTFNVTVGSNPSSPVFANSTGITITDNAPATPYPSTIDVEGVNGTVATVSVTLTGVNHPFPADIDALLVGPNGQAVVLMSDAGSGGPGFGLTNAWLIISDTASGAVPVNSPIQSFTPYLPTNYEVSNSEFASPAPQGPYAATFNGAFNGINPNGLWSLFVRDDASPDAGSIGSWVLSFTLNEVGPTLTGLVDTNGNENSLIEIPFVVGSATPSDVTFTTSSSNGGLISAIKVGGAGTNRVLQITPVQNQFGTTTITVSATDATGTRTRQFVLTVNHVDQPPAFASLPDITINGPATVVLNVTDVDTPLNQLTFQAATTGSGVIGNVQFTVNGGTASARITPTGTPGTDRLTISVSDGTTTVSQMFNVTFAPAGPPVLGPIADVTTAQNQPVSIPLNVSDPDTAISDLAFSASSSGTTLVQGAQFDLTSPNSVVLTLTPAPNASGTETITVSVSDGTATVNRMFNFTVGAAGPTIAPIADQSTLQNVSLTIPIIVSDATVPVGQLTLQASTDNQALVQGVTFVTIGTNVNATITPVPNASGVAHITVSVSNGSTASSRTFALTVISVCEPPVIASIGAQSAAAGASLTIPIPVTDANDPLTSLTFQASTAGGSVVSGATFNATSSGVTATFTLFANASGSDQVTVRASDGCGSSQQTFTLSVSSSTNPAPAVLSGSLSGTNFVLSVTGTVGATYVIESTSNFNTWNLAGTVTIGAGGTAQLTVPATGTAQFFRVRAGNSSGAKKALLVVGNATLVPGDLSVSNRLAGLGYTVTVKSAPSSTSADANGENLVVVSSTISSGDVSTKFVNTSVPVIIWENALSDDFGFNGNNTTTAPFDHGTTTNQTQLNILGTASPLTAGLSAGLHTIATSPVTVSWGTPQGSAIKIATVAGSPSEVAIFGYEAGATMSGANKAAGRRVFLYMEDATFASASPDANALFDAAVNWAAAGE